MPEALGTRWWEDFRNELAANNFTNIYLMGMFEQFHPDGHANQPLPDGGRALSTAHPSDRQRLPFRPIVTSPNAPIAVIADEIRDGAYNGTPLDWAEHNQQCDAANFLRKYASK